MTAFATSSSYAALPAIASVPLLAGESSQRGVFDFCTTLNKNGTTIYIAAIGSYVLFQDWHGTVNSLALVVLALSGLASVATAGLPFAAVFGLRMVLLASGSPGGIAWAILPIDPLVDRFVTVLNVFANLAACSRPKVRVAVATPVAPGAPPSAQGEAA
jgi:Na+/H+-dicarboxylate symporter